MAPAKKKDPADPTYDDSTMGRPEDGEGLTRHRAEDGTPPSDAVVLITPERGSDPPAAVLDPDRVEPEPEPEV